MNRLIWFYKEQKRLIHMKIFLLRDFISHHYFDIDAEINFDVIENHLPSLQESINKIILELKKEK